MTKRVQKTIKMTRKQWKAWDKHLTSGKIKQGDGCLINSEGAMCCLGVLEYALEGNVVDKSVGFPSDEFMKRHNITFLDRNGDDTVKVRSDENSPYLGGGYANELNDGNGRLSEGRLSFKQIAQRIKARVEFIPEKRKKK